MKRLIFILAALPLCLLAQKPSLVNTNWVEMIDKMNELINTPMFVPCSIIQFPDGTVLTNYQQVVKEQGKYIYLNNYNLPIYTNHYWESVHHMMSPRPDFVTEWEEYRNRMDILWCDYTNRMARAEERREKMRLAKERMRGNENGKPPKKPLRFPAPAKMIKSGNLNLKAERSAK